MKVKDVYVMEEAVDDLNEGRQSLTPERRQPCWKQKLFSSTDRRVSLLPE